jgi:hypothetical protein
MVSMVRLLQICCSGDQGPRQHLTVFDKPWRMEHSDDSRVCWGMQASHQDLDEHPSLTLTRLKLCCVLPSRPYSLSEEENSCPLVRVLFHTPTTSNIWYLRTVDTTYMNSKHRWQDNASRQRWLLVDSSYRETRLIWLEYGWARYPMDRLL